MKIVIVAAAYPFRGGIAHHTALLYRELSRKHSVEIATFTRQYPKFLFPGTTQHEEGGELLRVPTTQMIDSINPFTWIKTGLWIRQRNPDLIIFAYSMPFFAPSFGTIAAIGRRSGRTKILFLCHNIIPHEPIRGDTLLTRYAFSFADYFIVQSDQVERDLLKLVPNARYAVSPHPIYEMFGPPRPQKESRTKLGLSASKVILFFGYVRRYKGLGVLVDAMKHVKDRLPDIVLLVVGEFYEDEETFRNQVAAMGLQDSVKFVSHYVPQDQVADYFSAADVVVLPYLSATQSGIAQVGYNFDKPLIGTDVGGLGEVIRHGKTGYVVPPNDPKALADAIIEFYREDREEEFIRNVKVEKKKYSWANMAATIEKLVA